MEPNIQAAIISTLIKISPWAAATVLVFREICKLLAPVVFIIAIRFARTKADRDSLVKMFEASRTSFLPSFLRKKPPGDSEK